MERLIKSQYWTLVWIVAACLGLTILILPRLPDYACTAPLWLIVLSEWLFAFLVLLITQFNTLRHSISDLRIEPACLSLSLMFFINALAILFSPAAQLGSNGTVSIGAGQLMALTIGILFSILTIERVHNYGKDEEDNNALALQRVTSARLKHCTPTQDTHDQLSPPSELEVESVSDPPIFDETDEAPSARESTVPVVAEEKETNLPQRIPTDIPRSVFGKRSIQDLPAELRRLPSMHPNKTGHKIADPNKPQSTTISKLQALSASGIGSVHHPSVDPGNITHPKVMDAGLKSVLDRLDTPEQSQTEGFSAAPIETPSPIESISSPSTSPVFKQSVDKEMDNIFAKIAPVDAQQEVLPASNIEEVSQAPQESSVSVEQIPEARTFPVFKQSIDKEMDDVFAKIAPIDAQREVSPASKIEELPAQASSMFKQSVDKEMDDIFAKIAPIGAQQEVRHENKKLFQGNTDDQVEELFSGIAPAQEQREVADFVAKQNQLQNDVDQINEVELNANALAQQNAIAQELKDFGRLSAKASAGTPSTTPLGTMKTIGKLLIDTQDVDNIIKKAEAGNITVNLPSARVISAVRGEGIQSLLESIDNYHGVAGSMLVGGDGLVIASTYTTGGDRDSLGVLAHGIFGNSNLGVLRVDLGQLQQMIFVSEITENETTREVTTIITDVEVGSLAVFVDSSLAISLDQLLEQLSTIARG